MIYQIEFTLSARKRGFWLITSEVLSKLPPLPNKGLLNLFLKHTSCALSINENCDPDVRRDMETIYNELVQENDRRYCHTEEGCDDMPSHAKSTLTGVSINIPISNHKLNLGIWQGVYLCEFRDYGGERNIVATIFQ